MNDIELNRGLGLLADEAQPAAVDVYDIIAKARTRNRNRRATAATALATVTLAGALIGAIGLRADPQSTPVGNPPVSASPITGWSPQAGATMTDNVFNDNQMIAFTDQLAEAWPSVAPRGVAAEKLYWFAEGTSTPLEFRAYHTESPPDSITYSTAAELTDSLGTTELVIHVIDVGPHDWPFQTNIGMNRESSHDLADGTRVEIWSGSGIGAQRVTQVVRPDGTAILITENNSGTRPGFILDTQALLKLAKALSYS
jgi:hypothetical protein